MQSQSIRFAPILICGCLILLFGFAARASFGLFQIPVQTELGWPRSTFSFAIAIQNLAWGFGQPIFGAIAERFGDRKAIFLGIICYIIGLLLTSISYTSAAIIGYEVLIGFGIAGMGFGVILAMIGRAASEKNRSLALGVATAAGSAGQIIGPLVVANFLSFTDWRQSLVFMAIGIAACTLLLFLLPRASTIETSRKGEMKAMLRRALTDINYHYIFLGFFSCGFQLAFVTAHFPAMIEQFCGPIGDSFVRSLGISSKRDLGAAAIAIIGFMNIIGSILAGWLGRDFPKKYLLSLIYLGRTFISAWFILTPMTPTTVVVFSVIMGTLWLATVPLTSGLIGYIYGLKYLGTLYGLVFFSHQLGSFLGVWIGGAMFDYVGNYNAVWWIGVGVGLFSAIIHLPINEKSN